MHHNNKHDGFKTLKQLCLEKVSNCAQTSTLSQAQGFRIVAIPIDLSQEIFDFCKETVVAGEVNQILSFFLQEPSHTPLRQVCLPNARQANQNLIRAVVQVNLKTLTHLDVRGCRSLPKKFWSLLSTAPKLRSLKTTTLISPFNSPNLEILVVDWKPKGIVQRVQRRLQSAYYDNILEPVLTNLTYLDLSWCSWAKRLNVLVNAKCLEVLILRNCDISSLIDDISQLSRLRLLDISVGLEHELNHGFNGKYTNPEHILDQIITFLPNLECLDISGTNLITKLENGYDPFTLLEARRNRPFKFLGMYNHNQQTELNSGKVHVPALDISGNGNAVELMEAIKRNIDMPKTLRAQITRLKSLEDSAAAVDANILLEVQIRMLKNLRVDGHFRFWALKCLSNFLDHLESPVERISRDTKTELFLVLNRLSHSHSEEFEKLSELSLRFTFQIFLKLLPVEEINNDGMSREVIRLSKFLMSLNRTCFVYFKTEAKLFRLLHRLSLDRLACSYLSENGVVQNCFEFFKTIQVYLGFSLRVHQTCDIVSITWKSILSFMNASEKAIHDFIKYSGLSWMYAHLIWFSFDERTQRELKTTFMPILNLLEANAGSSTSQNIPDNHLVLMLKVKGMIQTPSIPS